MKNNILLLILLLFSIKSFSADFVVNFQAAPNSISNAEVSSITSSKVSDFTSSVTNIFNNLNSSSGGANTSLSNLSNVQFNTDFIFADTPLAYANGTKVISTGDASAPADLNGSDTLIIKSGASGFGSTGSLILRTSNATNNNWGYGTVTSGSIELETGTASNGPRGKIKFKDGTQGTVGHVWTQTAADGTGSWQPASSGGGGVNPSYIDASIGSVDVNSENTWVDVPNSQITINPSSASQMWEITYEGVMTIFTNSVGTYFGSVGIFDSSNVLVDNTVATADLRSSGGTSSELAPIKITARIVISSSATFKLRVSNAFSGSTTSIGYKDITGSLSGFESGEKFYAKRIF